MSTTELSAREMVISGHIGNYFFNDEAPSWKLISTALRLNNVKTIFGFQTLPEPFLKVLFQNNRTLLKAIPEFTYKHHQLIMMFIKEEYGLSNCAECGYFVRTSGFNCRRRFEPKDKMESKSMLVKDVSCSKDSEELPESQSLLVEDQATPETILKVDSDTSYTSDDDNV